MRKIPTNEERLNRKSKLENGCKVWTGYVTIHGRGVIISEDGRRMFAQDLAYEMNFGAIPEGQKVKQTCGNRLCLSKEHLALTIKRKPRTVYYKKKSTEPRVKKTKFARPAWTPEVKPKKKKVKKDFNYYKEMFAGLPEDMCHIGPKQIMVDTKPRYLHRLFLAEAHPEITKRTKILHSCGSPLCCNLLHMSIKPKLGKKKKGANYLVPKVKVPQGKGKSCPHRWLDQIDAETIREIQCLPPDTSVERISHAYRVKHVVVQFLRTPHTFARLTILDGGKKEGEHETSKESRNRTKQDGEEVCEGLTVEG